MPGYESSIGNKQFESTGFKEMNIPDESGYTQEPPMRRQVMPQEMQPQENTAELERRMRESKDARRMQMTKISEGAKKRLEILMGMTRTIREVTIGENLFELQSLKGKELRVAIMQAAEFDNTVQSPFEIRKQFLARSLTKIAGVPFDQFIGSNDMEMKLIFIEEMDDALLSRLYNEYLLLAKESREKFSIKTDAEAEEFVEDIKK